MTIGRIAPSLLLVLAGCAGAGPSDSVAAALTTEAKPAGPGDEMSSPTGRFQTISAMGTLDQTNPFFQSLGSNGRACVHCHQPADGWTVTPAHVQARFDATSPKGTDPIFRPVDGATSPNADVSTEAARRTAYAMLLQKGLIRVGIGVPANAEFDLIAVDDPYGYASDRELSLFRRPLPATNLGFLSAVMWDGRETFPEQSISFDLADQANGATLGHAQALNALDADTQSSIVNFESALFTAAIFDNDAKELTAKQGGGGPRALAKVPFYIGINDSLGADPGPDAAPFNPNVFTLYDGWAGAPGSGTDGARAAVARGQALFNTKPIAITGVAGLNDTLAQPTITGSCSTCHDTPGIGNHSTALPVDIGISDGARRTPDLPLYTLRNKTTGAVVTTTDPGRALITGRWSDIDKFKGPTLRGVSAHPPYFHNGSAATLDDVVNFYDTRFGIGLTAQEHADLVAFLKTL